MARAYEIPMIGTKGVFEFKHPVSEREDLNKQEYEVVELTSIKKMYEDGYDPYEDIYNVYGISEAQYVKDLTYKCPIVTLSLDDTLFIKLPASVIKSKPITSEITATERIISFSLGLLPDKVDLQPMYNNIKTLIKDTLSIDVDLKEFPGSDPVIISKEDYEHYVRLANSKKRSYNKSYRILYEEEVNRNELLKAKLDSFNSIIIKAHDKLKK